MAVSVEVLDTLKQGIECCRRGDWNEGLRHLGRIAERGDASSGLPGGVLLLPGLRHRPAGAARPGGAEALPALVKVEFYQADNYLNLARTCLLARDRSGAVRAVRDGLKIDPHHAGLLAVQKDLGVRGQPVLSFLGRTHFLNQFLGQLRHALRG